VLSCLAVAACSSTGDTNTRAHSSTQSNPPSPAATRSGQTLTPKPEPFRPERYGRRLRRGAPEPLRTQFARGQDNQLGVVSDTGPVVNGRGQVLVLTAADGADRGDNHPCPAVWEGLIRWASDSSSRVWTARVPPNTIAPTEHGFVIPASLCTRRTNMDLSGATDWYVDSRGRIGELRAIAGDPPPGTRADAPLEYQSGVVGTETTGEERSLLADRDSERIWIVDRATGEPEVPEVPEVPGNYAPGVLAQDVTGRRWVLDEYPGDFWWSDDVGATWQTHPVSLGSTGEGVYTDHTVGYVALDQVTVSTDRGETWGTHRIPDVRAVAVPEEPRIRRWEVLPYVATRSGTPLAFLRYSPVFSPPEVRPLQLLRSTNAT
jgi:hypothetical protein